MIGFGHLLGTSAGMEEVIGKASTLIFSHFFIFLGECQIRKMADNQKIGELWPFITA